MKPYYSENGIEIYHGDCREAMRALADLAVDSVVCDPPYELGFMGKGWDRSGIAYDVSVWQECLRVLKPGGHLLAFGGSRTYHRLACAIEDAGFEIRDQIQWLYGSGFPKSLDVSKAIDAAAGAEREIVGRKTDPRYEYAFNGNASAPMGNVDPRRERNDHALIYAPTTDAAKQWSGWGTALKPAHEPIVLARKPLIGTVAENVLQHGTGGLNIDGCRITVTADDDVHAKNPHTKNQAGGWSIGKKHEDLTPYDPAKGRWPANVIHDGSEEVLAGFPETASAGEYRDPSSAREGGNGMFAGGRVSNAYANELGSAARFFYCAKASKQDRGEGNNHPTVKPTQLMRYLVRLVTPPSGVVLDPFGGSGSTAKACRLEGFNCILIEKELEYCELAVRRASITHPGPCPKYGENRLNQEVLNFEAVA